MFLKVFNLRLKMNFFRFLSLFLPVKIKRVLKFLDHYGALILLPKGEDSYLSILKHILSLFLTNFYLLVIN